MTAHDPDYHANPFKSNNAGGAQRLLQLSVAHVTEDDPSPALLLVTDTRNPGGDESDSRIGLAKAGLAFDVADDGAAGGSVLDLDTVDFNSYDAIIVASDFGGWLRQEEVDILNARKAELAGYVAAGGGLIALAESGSRKVHVGVDSGRYEFVPVSSPIVAEKLDQHAANDHSVTPAGAAFGLTKADVNANATHAYFTATGGLDVLDVDEAGRPLSLATPPPAPPPPPPPPPTPPTPPTPPGGETGGFTDECDQSLGIRSVSVQPRRIRGRNGAVLRFRKRLARPIRIDIYQHSNRRKIYNGRLIARFNNPARRVRWDGLATRHAKGRKATDGFYVVLYTMRLGRGRGIDFRRRTLRRKGGSYRRRGVTSSRLDCTRLRSVRLRRPVFGGTDRVPLRLSFKLRQSVSLRFGLVRKGRLVRTRELGRPLVGRRRLVFVQPRGLPRGNYFVILATENDDGTTDILGVFRVRRI